MTMTESVDAALLGRAVLVTSASSGIGPRLLLLRLAPAPTSRSRI